MPIKHVEIPITVNFKVTELLNSEKIAQAVAAAYPSDPTLRVVGLTVPLLSFTCKNEGIINPISDIKNAISRMYDYLQKGIMKPIWTLLYKLYNILKSFGLGVLNLSLGVLNLKVDDLLNPNIYETIEKAVKDLYKNARNTLDKILSFLKIPNPPFSDTRSPEKEIEHFIKSILASLWSEFWKKVEEIKTIEEVILPVPDPIESDKKLKIFHSEHGKFTNATEEDLKKEKDNFNKSAFLEMYPITEEDSRNHPPITTSRRAYFQDYVDDVLRGNTTADQLPPEVAKTVALILSDFPDPAIAQPKNTAVEQTALTTMTTQEFKEVFGIEPKVENRDITDQELNNLIESFEEDNI
jgi:hypothetical protein